MARFIVFSFLPHATSFDPDSNNSYDVVGNTDGCTTYFEHEKGTDEALATGVNAVTSNIESGDFDITQQRSAFGQSTGIANFKGDGEHIMKIRRFVPDFLSQTGNTQVTLQLKNYQIAHKPALLLDPLQLLVLLIK